MTTTHEQTDNKADNKADAQISLHLPPGWQTRNDPEAGIVARSRPRRRPPDGVPAEIVVRTRRVEEDLQAWRSEALAALATQLQAFELEDEDDYDVGPGRACYHRFGHRLGTAELISEQWSWLVDGTGVTLTCTVVRSDYLTYCDLFEDVALTVEILSAAA